MRNDLSIGLGEALENGAMLPLTALADQFHAEVQATGGRRWDTSSLLARLGRHGVALTGRYRTGDCDRASGASID